MPLPNQLETLELSSKQYAIYILYSTLRTIIATGATLNLVAMNGAVITDGDEEAYLPTSLMIAQSVGLIDTLIKTASLSSTNTNPQYKQAWDHLISLLEKYYFILQFSLFIAAEVNNDIGKNEKNDDGSDSVYASIVMGTFLLTLLTDPSIRKLLGKKISQSTPSNGIIAKTTAWGGYVWSRFSDLLSATSLMHGFLGTLEKFIWAPTNTISRVIRYTGMTVYGVTGSGILKDLFTWVIEKFRRQNQEKSPLLESQSSHEEEESRFSKIKEEAEEVMSACVFAIDQSEAWIATTNYSPGILSFLIAYFKLFEFTSAKIQSPADIHRAMHVEIRDEVINEEDISIEEQKGYCQKVSNTLASLCHQFSFRSTKKETIEREGLLPHNNDNDSEYKQASTK